MNFEYEENKDRLKETAHFIIKKKGIIKREKVNKLNLTFILKVEELGIFKFIMVLSFIIFIEKLTKNNEESINHNNLQTYIEALMKISNNTDKRIANTSNYREIIKRIKTEKDFLEISKSTNVKEMAHIYYMLCIRGILFDNKTTIQKVSNPKISIILPVYNRQNDLLRVLRSIQNQSMKDIEIIFVDDCSSDNSTKILDNFQKNDERIIIIKHEKNKGTLICRNEGIYISKGEYIMFVDSDDLLLYNILDVTYKLAKKNNSEIVQFAAFQKQGNKYWNFGDIRKNNTPIYQPQLSSLMYYSRGYLKQTDSYLWGKLIKKEALNRTLASINKFYLNNHMSMAEDGLIYFMLLKKAKSYIYIYYYGYLYFRNRQSATRSMNKHNINKFFRDYFFYLKYMFEYTGRNYREKSMAAWQIRHLFNHHRKKMYKVTENFGFFIKILNLYIKCPYINKYTKRKARGMEYILGKAKQASYKPNNISK